MKFVPCDWFSSRNTRNASSWIDLATSSQAEPGQIGAIKRKCQFLEQDVHVGGSVGTYVVFDEIWGLHRRVAPVD
jgi:hypothetical protein